MCAKPFIHLNIIFVTPCMIKFLSESAKRTDRTKKVIKMVKIVVETFGEDALRKLFLDLSQKDDWDEECDVCRMPTLLHHDSEGRQMLGSCARRREELSAAAQNKADAELMNSWSLFRKKMNPIRKWYRDEVEKKKTSSDILAGLQSMTDAIVNGNKERPSKLVKPTKVPSWCAGMKYQA